MGRAIGCTSDRGRSGMAKHRQHDQPSPPARRRWKRGPAVHGIGRSRGGATTKVHLVVDALGLPLAFELTEGQRHDIVPASGLVERTRPRCLLADKAYSSHDFRAVLDTMACQPVISVVDVVDPSPSLRQGAVQGTRRSRVHVQPTQTGPPLRDSLREDATELRSGRRHRLRAALVANPGTVDVIAPVIAPVIVAVHVNGNATVIVIRPVDGNHATAEPSGR